MAVNLKHFDLFAHGAPTEFTGEWRHVGNFEAPDRAAAEKVAFGYMRETGIERVRVFTRSNSCIGRLVTELVRVSR